MIKCAGSTWSNGCGFEGLRHQFSEKNACNLSLGCQGIGLVVGRDDGSCGHDGFSLAFESAYRKRHVFCFENFCQNCYHPL